MNKINECQIKKMEKGILIYFFQYISSLKIIIFLFDVIVSLIEIKTNKYKKKFLN